MITKLDVVRALREQASRLRQTTQSPDAALEAARMERTLAARERSLASPRRTNQERRPA